MTTAETVTLSWPPDPRDAHPTAAPGGVAGGSGPSALVIPSRLGSVRLIRELGHGGMGVVWLGHHEFLDRQVAVKFLLATVADRDDPKFQMFLDGARAAAQVRHLGLTAVLHADMVEHVPYLVMEYVSGPTLAELVERTGPLRPAAVLAVLERVADALDELHEAGVVHRDVKPSNILVDIQGQAYLTDFGLACRLENRERIATSGTPTYMAPESFDGEASARTDIYSLAATVYHLLSGRAPFAGSAAELRELHCTQKFPVDPLRAVSVPEPVIEALDRAANIDPRFRTKSARKLLEGFREAIGKANAAAAGVDQLARLVAALTERGGGVAPADHGSGSGVGGARQGSGSPIAESQVLDQPVPCVACGYELRGLPIAARCPECQHPIERSLEPGRLIFADPAWLKRIQSGLLVMAASQAVLLLTFIGVAIDRMVANTITPRRGALSAGAALLSLGVLTLGSRLATSRELSEAVRHPYRPLHWRYVAIASLVTASLCAFYMADVWIIAPSTSETRLGLVLWLVAALPLTAFPSHITSCTCRLLGRGSRGKLRWTDAVAMVGAGGAMVVAVGFSAVILSVQMLSDQVSPTWLGSGFLAISFFAAFPLLVVLSYLSWRIARTRRELVSPLIARGRSSGDTPSKSTTYYQSLSTFAGRRRGGSGGAASDDPASGSGPPPA